MTLCATAVSSSTNLRVANIDKVLQTEAPPTRFGRIGAVAVLAVGSERAELGL